jgi:hypothetical protein
MDAVYKTLLFFIVRGCLVPNLDDSTYYILINEFGLEQVSYDQLIIGQSAFILLGTIFWYSFMQKMPLNQVIAIQCGIELVISILMYDSLSRTQWVPALCIALVVGKGSFFAFAMLPTLVELTYMIPMSVESSMASLFFACLNFSFDWGGKFMTAIMFKILGIDEDTFRVNIAIGFKIVMLVLFLVASTQLPNK